MSAVVETMPQTNPVLIAAFVDSIQTVVPTMLSLEVSVGEPMPICPNQAHDVVSILGFSGEVVGVMSLCFSLDVAASLVEAFTGTRFTSDSPDFADAIGELANMIGGGAKSRLDGRSSIAVPSVVIGKRCHVATPREAPCCVLPCSTPVGKFEVTICLEAAELALIKGAKS